MKKKKNIDKFSYSDIESTTENLVNDDDVKHGRLEKESEIYNKSRHETITKEEFKNYTFKQKLSHFKEYYLTYTLIITAFILAIGLVVGLTVKRNKNKDIYYCGMMDHLAFNEEDTKEIKKNFAEYLNNIDYKNKKITSDDITFMTYRQDILDNVSMDGAYDNKIFDSFILSSSLFEKFVGTGKLRDLRDVFTDEELDKFGSKIVYVVDNDGESIPYGILLDDSKYDFHRSTTVIDKEQYPPIYSVPMCSQHLDVAKYFLLYFLSVE